jgi:hypothetical protein
MDSNSTQKQQKGFTMPKLNTASLTGKAGKFNNP